MQYLIYYISPSNQTLHDGRIRRFAVTLPGRFERSHEQHKAIVATLERGKSEAAGQIMEDHLASVPDELLAHMDMWMPHLEGAGNGIG